MKPLVVEIEIELLSAVSFPARSASVGVARSLDYVPGAALLGACARRLVEGGADGATIWRLLLSGRSRFGPGLPVSSRTGLVGWPMPLSFHRPKDEGDTGVSGTLSGAVRNLARPGGEAIDSEVPLEQLRGGYLTGTLEVLQPRRRSSMRTAIGAQGRVREGFLYVLDALEPGQRFRARIEFDQGQDDDTERLDRVTNALLDDRPVRLGRSRNQEFGEALVRRVEVGSTLPRAEGAADVVLLYAASDLALRDPETGAPTLRPRPETLGIDDASAWSWDPDRSFVRVRRYSPFHGRRRRPDLERQVICAGSVLAYTPGAGRRGIEDFEKAVCRGVGDYRHDGLGRVVVEPPFLAHASPRAWEEPLAPPPGAERVEPPDDELWRWLEARDARVRAEDEAFEIAGTWCKRMRRFPPMSSSQWAVVRRLAETSSTRTAFLEKFVEATRTGVAMLERRWGAKRAGKTRSEALEELVREACGDDETVLSAISQMAARLAREPGADGAEKITGAGGAW